MKDKINSILSEAKAKITAAVNENELQNMKSAYIGKQGSLSLLMKELPKLNPEVRPEMGKILNQAVHILFGRSLNCLRKENQRAY